MNLSILLTDFIDTKGMLKTYRFIPINQYNRIVVDRLSDICTDVKGNTDKDVGLLRVYNSDKCQLLSTTCKIKDFTDSYVCSRQSILLKNIMWQSTLVRTTRPS